MLVYAHRGSSGTDPENTLGAFRQAIVDGADGIEFDVHATSDGVPIVIHDRDVARTTDGKGFVDEMTLSEVKELNAGQGERVPTLEEVLDLTSGRLKLYVEIKQRDIAASVLATLAKYPQADWLIASFDFEILREARKLAPDAELWPIAVAATEDLFSLAEELQTTALSLHLIGTTQEVIDRCRDAGLGVDVWTVNDPGDAQRMREVGAAAICTDFPARIIAAL